MNKRFANKVVLVTGGGRGIGKAIVQAFAAEGAKVMIAARTLKYGEQVAETINANGGVADVVQAENSNRDSMKAMVETTVQRFGGIDIVVHSAAHWTQDEIIDMPEEDFDALINSNIKSLYWLTKDAAPYLSQSPDKGRLLFISSGAANRQYMAGSVVYAATKTFMNFFARGLAMELGKKNILVNVVEPGLIASDRVNGNLSESVLDALTAGYPVPRPGEPAEIAHSVLFLASNEAAYITGTNLLVDGGGSMSPVPNLEQTLNEASKNKDKK